MRRRGNVTIVSDGTSQGTRVMVGDQAMQNVERVQISDISPGGIVRATITVMYVPLGATGCDKTIQAKAVRRMAGRGG